jgi:hypothetical protein
MKTLARRIAVVLSATAFTVGLMGAVAPAAAKTISGSTTFRATGWNCAERLQQTPPQV